MSAKGVDFHKMNIVPCSNISQDKVLLLLMFIALKDSYTLSLFTFFRREGWLVFLSGEIYISAFFIFIFLFLDVIFGMP